MLILFYRQNENPYGAFSNFAEGYPMELDGQQWPTTEHYFQAMKFPDHPEIMEQIRCADRPMRTKEIVAENAGLVNWAWWDSVRDEVMLRALRAKYSQHGQLKKLILSTGDEELVENAKRDNYWGIGADGSGKNMLGRLLMQVRDELRSAGDDSPAQDS